MQSDIRAKIEPSTMSYKTYQAGNDITKYSKIEDISLKWRKKQKIIRFILIILQILFHTTLFTMSNVTTK